MKPAAATPTTLSPPHVMRYANSSPFGKNHSNLKTFHHCRAATSEDNDKSLQQSEKQPSTVVHLHTFTYTALHVLVLY